jgi:hypothetical protein
MNKRGCLNYRDFAFALTLSKQNIILLPGSLPGASRDYEEKPKFAQSFPTLIATTIMAQFIVLAIFVTVVYQTERKIFTLQTEPNTPEEVSGVKKVNGEIEPRSTDT